MAGVNNIRAPADVMMAQYAIPFCVALAHHRSARSACSTNPRSKTRSPP